MLGALGRVFPPLPPDFAVFQRKFQLFSAVFRMFSIFLQPIPRWAAGIFCFFRQFSVCFQIFHFIPINYNKEDFHYEHHYRHRPRLLRHQNSPPLVSRRADKLRRTRTLHPPRTLRVWRVLFCLWYRAAAYFKIFPPQATAVIYDIRQGMEKLIGKYWQQLHRLQ